jgi:hypothetical protein
LSQALPINARTIREQYGDPEALPPSCDPCRAIWCVKVTVHILERVTHNGQRVRREERVQVTLP